MELTSIIRSRYYLIVVLSVISIIIILGALFPHNLLNLLPTQSNGLDPSEIGEATIPIYQMYSDLEYAWQKLLTRQDNTGPINTKMFFGTEVVANVNNTLASGTELLASVYAMYKLTNDSNYLDIGWEMFQDMMKYRLRNVTRGSITGEVLVNYDVKTDVIDDSIIPPVNLFVPIALEDPRYIPYFERLTIGSHKLFWSPINLIYKNINSDGSIRSTDCHITWAPSVHKKIMQLFWMYHLTGNVTYKQWGDLTIEAFWNLRSKTTNLIPRGVDAITGGIKDATISHYDMTGWLSALELAYYICGADKTAGTLNNTYYDLIDKTASGIAEFIWNEGAQRWDYKADYKTGGPSSAIPEMNSIYVDYAMIRAYQITGKTDFLTKAIQDFDTCFIGSSSLKEPTGVLIHNSLVIHSPNTLKYQSQMTGSSNIMVARTANLIYLATGDPVYLQKASYHYSWLMEKHKFEKGYTTRLYTLTMEPEGVYNGNEAEVNDVAPIIATFALPNAFVLSGGVTIDWGFDLSSCSPNEYGNAGMISGVEIDTKEHKILLKRVSSPVTGQISVNYYPKSIITAVKVDNLPYSVFTNLSVTTLEGLHSYETSFSEPDLVNSNTSTSLTTTTSTSVSTSSETSQSSEQPNPNNTNGFLLQSVISSSLMIVIYARNRKRK